MEADNIDGALEKMEERFGSQLREQVQAHGIQLDGKIRDYSQVLLNGVNLRNLKQTELKDGDVLHIFPPGAGG